AARPEPPVHQLDPVIRDDAWALHRAHVLAGRYFLISGIDPRSIVPAPAWSELETALREELRFVETHPDARAFGILNAARVAYSLETREVVLSKYQAGQWALEMLPADWHDAIRAALRRYARAELEGDVRILESSWAPFVAYVKRAL